MSSNEKLIKEVQTLKQLIIESNKSSMCIDGWINQKTLLRFLDCSLSTLRKLEKQELIISKKIGRKKFYQIKSITKLLNKKD